MSDFDTSSIEFGVDEVIRSATAVPSAFSLIADDDTHIYHHRWSVAKRDGRWRVIDRGVWSETYDTLPEAHTVATTHATADLLYAPGGLALFSRLLDACDWIYDRKATP